jgi:hypothetical protein
MKDLLDGNAGQILIGDAVRISSNCRNLLSYNSYWLASKAFNLKKDNYSYHYNRNNPILAQETALANAARAFYDATVKLQSEFGEADGPVRKALTDRGNSLRAVLDNAEENNRERERAAPSQPALAVPVAVPVLALHPRHYPLDSPAVQAPSHASSSYASLIPTPAPTAAPGPSDSELEETPPRKRYLHMNALGQRVDSENQAASWSLAYAMGSSPQTSHPLSSYPSVIPPAADNRPTSHSPRSSGSGDAPPRKRQRAGGSTDPNSSSPYDTYTYPAYATRSPPSSAHMPHTDDTQPPPEWPASGHSSSPYGTHTYPAYATRSPPSSAHMHHTGNTQHTLLPSVYPTAAYAQPDLHPMARATMPSTPPVWDQTQYDNPVPQTRITSSTRGRGLPEYAPSRNLRGRPTDSSHINLSYYGHGEGVPGRGRRGGM